MLERVIGSDRIVFTETLIRPYIRRTPIIEIDGGEVGIGPSHVVLKLELLQHSGSFKARGAFAHLLTRDVPAAGVVAASGGNHGAAVAFAAHALGKRATIFVPSVASPAKLDRIRRYGGHLVISGTTYADALAASRQWSAESGALEVHAYDQVETLLGQASVGVELDQQDPGLDSLLVAVGGGGLIGGIASWYRGRVTIVGVEPEASPALERALRAGRPVDAPVGGIAADSLGATRVGELMFPLARAYVHHVVLVPDAAIVEAQRRLWDVLRLATEPGGAAAFAALLSRRYEPEPGERVGVLVCGGNTHACDPGSPAFGDR